MTKIALVDQDGVLAGWSPAVYGYVEEECQRRGIEVPHPIQKVQTTWELETGHQLADELIMQAMQHPELYLNLPVIEGGLQGLETLERLGYEVFICTSPSSFNENCASHKLAWIRRELGERWVKKTIQTVDKTLVRGEILIDDKPKITGAMRPTWEHIVFDTPYNQETGGRRLHSWDDLEGLLSSERMGWEKIPGTSGWYAPPVDPEVADNLMRERLREREYRSTRR